MIYRRSKRNDLNVFVYLVGHQISAHRRGDVERLMCNCELGELFGKSSFAVRDVLADKYKVNGLSNEDREYRRRVLCQQAGRANAGNLTHSFADFNPKRMSEIAKKGNVAGLGRLSSAQRSANGRKGYDVRVARHGTGHLFPKSQSF